MLITKARKIILLITLLFISSSPSGAAGADASLETREGRLAVTWGDPQSGSDAEPHQVLRLIEESGASIELEISPALRQTHGGVLSWNGRLLEVTGEVTEPGGGPVAVRSGDPLFADDFESGDTSSW